jgi:outer membrane protein
MNESFSKGLSPLQVKARPALLLVCLLAPFVARAEQKIAGVNLRDAMLGTQEGQKGRAVLEQKYAEMQKKFAAMRAELEQLQMQYQQRSNVASEEARNGMARELETKGRAFERAAQDAQEDLQDEQERLLGDVQSRLLEIIDAYAKKNGYDLVFDSSLTESGLLHVASAVDITDSVISDYDQKHGVAPAAGAGASDGN